MCVPIWVGQPGSLLLSDKQFRPNTFQGSGGSMGHIKGPKRAYGPSEDNIFSPRSVIASTLGVHIHDSCYFSVALRA